MLKKERVAFIMKTLEELYPETPVPLDHTDPFTLLVAVLLSAQCTDKRVNLVTPGLFALADNPYDMAQQSPEDIRAIIRPCGLSERKANNIRDLSRILIDKHNGQVPEDLAALEELPGVGHKTAQVVVAQAFGIPSFPVDTHILRLAQRWRLTKAKGVGRTEKDLKAAFPKKSWNKLHLQIIFFGREYCPARGHNSEACPICSVVG